MLNLFAPEATTSALTGWDMAYLEALYSGDDQRLDPEEQAAALTERLRRVSAEE